MIDFFAVSKRFPGGQTALEEVTFHLDAGEFVFLTGASGAGKTTLLRLIYREEVPSSGTIVVNGRNVATLPSSKVPYLRRSIGVVFQSFRLIERKTVFENVAYLPRILGAPLAEQRSQAFAALSKVGLGHRMSAFPRQLSGGEQQRVAVARALVNRPDILLADEPTGNLDPELSLEVLRLFRRVRGSGTTVVLATHDPRAISIFGGRVLVLERGSLVDDRVEVGSEAELQREEEELRRRKTLQGSLQGSLHEDWEEPHQVIDGPAESLPGAATEMAAEAPGAAPLESAVASEAEP